MVGDTGFEPVTSSV